MVLRKKNLLDAFRQAAPEGRKAAAPSGPSGSGAGGPFAPAGLPAPKDSQPTSKFRFEPARQRERAVLAPTATVERSFMDRRVRIAVLVLALIGVGAYFVARFAAKPARAADPDSSGADAGKGALASGLAAGADLVEKNQ